MKIAFFTDTYEPQINGVVTSINRFVRELRRRGHKVYIFSPSSPGTRHDRFVKTFRSIPFNRYPGYRIGFPLTGLKEKFDIIHVHTPATIGLCGALLARHYKLPLVGTYHTLLPEYTHYLVKGSMEKITKKALWKYTSLFYNKCDCVIAPSDETRKELKKHGIKNVKVIPTGISLKGKPVKHRGKTILHVGRLCKEKNIQFIMEALKNLLVGDTRLVITSDGPYKDDLMKLAKKLKIENNVVFTGYLSEKELGRLYARSDLFVMASKSETQGIVLTEAMAFSLPVVVLDSPVTGNFVRQNKIGLVAGSKNFASCVKKLLQGRKKNVKYPKEYDIKKCTDRLMEIYKMVKNHCQYSARDL
jgi:1,2-diacylglycerol 3-alpha-glucosyltransferase